MQCVLCRHGPLRGLGSFARGGRPTFCWPDPWVTDGGGCGRVIFMLSARPREHVWLLVMGLLGPGGVPAQEG
jgi:hypothetical protein